MTEESKKKQHKDEKPLEKMTVKDLRDIALEIPHDHATVAVRDMKKEELVAFIKEARGIVDEEPAKKKVSVKAEKVALTKPEVKQKIRALRKEKKAAQDAKETKKADILRRRINKLKKLSRKIA
ncbi:MAG TPA: transcription termination factor Rho [Deltaproteobacteria bacterium]|nr:transcription termination factor Rho [Deltaproteobacteria bacterium]HPJ93133.1 transcription termination factor Rho [Deltaproteobacteria bacterium]HPR51183.1 transcription termination factor Rho [Deltaproteobacteria bacterium]